MITFEDLVDPIAKLVKKFENHPSILKIKEKVSARNFSFPPISLAQVEKEIQSLDTKKATTKNIPVKQLQDCLDVCKSTLHQIINESLTNNKFPDDLKLADVTPVFKSGDKTNVKNYRPISVLPTVSKLLERIMQNQIISHIENYLCGYRKGYGTQHALVSLIEKWRASIDKGGILVLS